MENTVANYVLPRGTIIYTEERARIPALSGEPCYRSKRAFWGAHYPNSLPDAWERFYEMGSYPGGRAAFGHVRTSENGTRWSVRLEQVNTLEAGGGSRKVGFAQRAFRQIGTGRGCMGFDIQEVSFVSKQMLLGPSDVVTFFAPQPDSGDASRIFIPYELNGRSGQLSGTVMDRGYVEFAVESGAARVVSP